MKVSIVTISFNQAKFLERAIRSVLAQDYPDIEYIVVDPGSTDGSRDIIERFRNRIAKIVYKPDKGAAEGLNNGFELSTGGVFGFLNSDDVLLPGAVSSGVEKFKQYPNCDVLCANGYRIDGDGVVLRRTIAARFGAQLYAYGATSFQQPSVFFRAKAFRDVGGFNEKNFTCWDGELFAEMALAGAKFRTVHEYWSAFTLHPAGLTGGGHNHEAYRRDCSRLFERITGHKERRIDRLWFAFSWLFAKHLGNPIVPLAAVADRLGLRPERVL